MRKYCKYCDAEFDDSDMDHWAFRKYLGQKALMCRIHKNEQRIESYRRHRSDRIQKNKEWKKDNVAHRREYHRSYCRERRKDPIYRAVAGLRSRLWELFKRTKRPTGHTIQWLGCSPIELRSYLESLFLPGMSWENYGKWHIDHVRPLASFDLNDPEQLRNAFCYTNLQPLWALDNLRKGAKVGP